MSTIQGKTIRPGSLKGYSYYYSGRRPYAPPTARPAKAKAQGRRGSWLVVLLVLIAGFWLGTRGNAAPPADHQTTKAAAVAAPVTDHCVGNTLNKLIKVGIDEKHLWVCQGSQMVYDSPVITGLRNNKETETPVGTYKIYAKQTHTTLTGSDSRGSWRDPVYYWMPFLTNRYGTYGFHDATWRDNNAFGNVSPDSSSASHGCVELPLTTSKWLYRWASVGTTVSIES